MPQYNFLCRACKEEFSKILTILESRRVKTACPKCGKQERRAAVGGLRRRNLQEELVRLDAVCKHMTSRHRWSIQTHETEMPTTEQIGNGLFLRRLFFSGYDPWPCACP